MVSANHFPHTNITPPAYAGLKAVYTMLALKPGRSRLLAMSLTFSGLGKVRGH